MSSSVASACSIIAFALKCFAKSLFCLFSFAYSAEMNVLMFAHVLSAAGFASHSRTAGSNSPVALSWKSAMSRLSLRSEVIPFLCIIVVVVVEWGPIVRGFQVCVICT